MGSLLVASNVSYSYPDGTVALAGVNFELRAGETVALFGANGSGKTTFVRHINGILRGQGHLQVCGLELNDRNLKAIRRKVGVVFQDPDDQIFMPSVLEDVAFAPLAAGHRKPEAESIAQSALERVGFTGDTSRSPFHLSAGEKRRVAIAGVLAQAPELLVLDEPTTFLDPPAQRTLARIMGDLPQGKLLVTHDAEFAAYVADRAVFFSAGKIVAAGSVAEIVSRYKWRVAELT